MNMDPKHKLILKRNRTKLPREIPKGAFEDVVQELFSQRIITNNMMENILCKETQTKQVYQLLDILPTREPESFDVFYDVLLENDLGTAADLLKPELAESRKKERRNHISQESTLPTETQDLNLDDELPTEWPIKERCNESYSSNLNPVLCSAANKEYNISCLGQSKQIYKMSAQTRGLVLIINNKNFDDEELSTRIGTENDVIAIEYLFTKFGFEVDIRPDKTGEGILTVCKEFSKKDHTQYDCFVCFILTHGKNKHVYGVDGKAVPLEKIYVNFEGNNCESLLMKPKIFFIQSCQVDHSLPSKVNQNDGEEMTDGSATHSKSDFLKIHATVKGDPSYRYYYGTRFIFTWIYILEKFAYKYELQALNKRVGRLMEMWKSKDNTTQISELRYTSAKDFYFFPGLSVGESDNHAQLPGAHQQVVGGSSVNPLTHSAAGDAPPCPSTGKYLFEMPGFPGTSTLQNSASITYPSDVQAGNSKMSSNGDDDDDIASSNNASASYSLSVKDNSK